MTSELTDIKRFHAGDRALIAEIYHRHYAAVERAVSRYCHGADADAVIHDVFAGLMEKTAMRESFQGGNLGAWLRTVAANRAKDRLRKQRREVLVDDPATLDDDEALEAWAAQARADDVHFVHQVMARYRQEHVPRLPKTLQRAFGLLFVEGLSVKEIAERESLPRTTVSSWRSRLLERIGPFMRRILAEGS